MRFVTGRRFARNFVAPLAMLMASCGRDPVASRQQILERGDRLFTQKQYTEAALIYRKALQQDGVFAEAWYRLGLCEQQLHNSAPAFTAFTQAATHDPNHEGAATRLAELEIGQLIADKARSKELSASVERRIKKLFSLRSDSFDGNRLSGLLAMAEADPGRAIDFLERALKKSPFEPGTATALVQNLFLAGRPADAMKLAGELIEKQPKFGPIYDIVYFRHLETGNVAQAEAVLIAKATQLSDSAEAQLQLCQHYLRSRKLAELEQAERKFVAQSAQFPDARIKLGGLHSQFNDMDGAIRLYEEGGKADPTRRVTYDKRIAEALMAGGRLAEARKRIESVLEQSPGDTDAKGALAILWVRGRQPKEIDLAIVELEKLLIADSRSVPFRYNLALAFEAKQDWKQARRHLKQLLANDPAHPQALQTMTSVSLRLQEFADVLRYGRQVLEKDPGNIPVEIMSAVALAGQGFLPDSDSRLRALIRKHPEEKEARVQLALIQILQKRYPEAEALLRREYQADPGDARTANGLIQLYSAQGKHSQALPILEQQLVRQPNSLETRMMAAQTAARDGRLDVAVSHYEKAIALAPGKAEPYLAAGQLHLAGNRPAQAIEYLKKAVAIDKSNALAFALLGQALSLAGQNPAALSAYRDSLTINPKQPIVLNNMADLLVNENGDLNEALRYSKAALDFTPNQPDFADTLGMVYLKMNQVPAATAAFRSLCARHPAVAAYRYHLGLALFAAGDKNKAHMELQASLRLQPDKQTRAKVEDLLNR